MSTTSQPSKADKSASQASEYSGKSLIEIDRRKLLPSPENYAVFYHVAAGNNLELIKEIDQIEKNGIPFNKNTAGYLFKKFVIKERNEDIVNDAAENVTKLLGDALKTVSSFDEDTTDYNKDIETYMEKISVEVPDENLQQLVRQVVNASSEMRKQGEDLSGKLKQSREEIENLKANLEQVTKESQVDFLTGAYNRKAFDRMLDEALDEVKQEGQPLCLLMTDVDHFKKFNDTFGHLLGDEVLKIVAASMKKVVRGADIVARYGGEEFAVILPNTPINGANKVAESIRNAIAKRELKRKDSGESYGQITISIGLSVLKPDDTALTLIKRADDALYKAKATGRNKVMIEGQ